MKMSAVRTASSSASPCPGLNEKYPYHDPSGAANVTRKHAHDSPSFSMNATDRLRSLSVVMEGGQELREGAPDQPA